MLDRAGVDPSVAFVVQPCHWPQGEHRVHQFLWCCIYIQSHGPSLLIHLYCLSNVMSILILIWGLVSTVLEGMGETWCVAKYLLLDVNCIFLIRLGNSSLIHYFLSEIDVLLRKVLLALCHLSQFIITQSIIFSALKKRRTLLKARNVCYVFLMECGEATCYSS